MSEWQTVTTDELSPQTGTSFRPASGRSWVIWVTMIVIILAVAGFLGFRHQRAGRQQALHEDLKAHILLEETERFLGHEDQVPNLIIPGASPDWQQAYRGQFDFPHPQSPPGSIEINEVEFDAQCALTTFKLAGQAQIRYYCLSNTGWLRAPIEEMLWGEPEREVLQNGMTLHFRSRDRAFAEALTSDLNRFFEVVAPYQAEASGAMPSEIVIQPQEFQWLPAPRVEEDRIIINSPWVATSQELRVEAMMRWALGIILLQQVGPELPPSLPGSTGFHEALKSAIAMQLLLPAEDQAGIVNAWRADLGPEWISPFFAEFTHSDQTDWEQQAKLTASLTAHYLTTQKDATALLALLKQIPETTSWDHLFEATFGRSTVVLEQEALQYAYQASDTPPPLASQASVPWPQPLVGTLSKLEPQPDGRYRAYIKVPGQSWPLPVELPAELSLQLPEGGRLAPGCVAPGAQLEVTGSWLEAQRRLEATEIAVQGEITPLELGPAPADTIAYLVQGETPEAESSQPEATNQAAALKPNYLSAYRTLLALRSNNILHSLTLLNPNTQVLPLPMAAENKVQLLFTLNLAGCDRTWFIHYRPDQGIVGQWLAPPEPMQWLWRADKQDFIFFGLNPRSLAYEIYRGGPAYLPELMGSADIPLLFVGWNTETGRFVSNVTRFQETYLGLFDLASGTISFRPHNSPLRYYTLSPSGNWLAYLNRAQARSGPLQRLEVLNMNDRSEATRLVELSGDNALLPPIWSMNPTDPKIAVLGGPVAPGQLHPFPKWLVLADVSQPEGALPLAEALEGEALGYPVFCADGSLVYRVAREGQYRLIYYNYGARRETWLTLNWPFQPLACP